jgi:CRISPR/Cas system CSM-associated protein Csm2 small subunit
MFIKPKNRFHAFGIHIFISALIFIVLAIIITYLWYPGFLFKTDGGWNGIRLIAGIDFIIGPTLTLIIYKIGKKGLKFDLIIIGFIQLSCLGFGTWTVYQQRPIAVMYSNGEFLAKSQALLDLFNIDRNKIYALDTKVPAWIYIELPEDKDEKSKTLASQLYKGPIYTHIQRYASYKENLQRVFKEAIDPSTLDDNIRKKITPNGKVYPYSARYGYGYIEIDKNTGDFINVY